MGDTLKVLEAVLDTNFWLATHVVCVTLGYATTVLAGLIGIFLFLKAIEGDKDLGPAEWFGTILITVFNTAFLWAAACGIDVLGTAGAGSEPSVMS